jgi:hypothetical protein
MGSSTLFDLSLSYPTAVREQLNLTVFTQRFVSYSWPFGA